MEITKNNIELKVSNLAENIIGSEIIKLAGEVNEKIKQGEQIFNLTIGDFDPNVFPIPLELKNFIIEEYTHNATNYPAADGMLELRQSISKLLELRGNLHYATNEIVVAGGARPLIYSLFRVLIDQGDKIIFPVPSWNNNHYTYLNGGVPVLIDAGPESNFMPTAEKIKPHISDATLVALCSPQNPTGTVFTKEELCKICELVLEENKNRPAEKKPIYLMYDQIYWALTYGDTEHFNPVSLYPEMKNYTVFIDGISKSLAATGVRVGWSMGPKKIIEKMKAILTHVGAWAPKAEQLATAKYLHKLELYDKFLVDQKHKLEERLVGFYEGFQNLKKEGHPVDAISPKAAIYLTIQFNLIGKKTASGQIISNTQDITKFILDEAKIAVVPFYAFGASPDSTWYRLSVGTCKLEDVSKAIESLRKALHTLV